MDLSIGGGDSSITGQAKTQSPQASVGPSASGTPSGRVQPGTDSSQLTTQTEGISLTNQVLPSVTLGAVSATTRQPEVPSPVLEQRHSNPILLGVAGVLFIIAIVVFLLITRSAKTTTK